MGDIIYEIERVKQLMKINCSTLTESIDKKILTEQSALYRLMRDWLEPVLSNFTTTKKPTPREDIFHLKPGNSDVNISRDAFEGLFGNENGTIEGLLRRNNEPADDAEFLRLLNTNDEARSAMLSLINALDPKKIELAYENVINNLINRWSQRNPNIQSKKDLIRNLVNDANKSNTYNRDYEAFVKRELGYTDLNYELFGKKIQKDMEDMSKNKYVDRLTDKDIVLTDKSYRELVPIWDGLKACFKKGGDCNLQPIYAYFRARLPLFWKSIVQRYGLTTSAKGNLIVGGEAMLTLLQGFGLRKGNEFEQKLLRRVERIYAKQNPETGKPIEGSLADAESVLLTIINAKKWIDQRITQDIEKWIVENKFLDPKIIEKMKQKGYWTEIENMVKLDVGERLQFITKQSAEVLAEMVPFVSALSPTYRKKMGNWAKALFPDLRRWLAVITYKSPYLPDELVALQAGTGVYSKLLGSVATMYILHYQILPQLYATAAKETFNVVRNSILEDLKQMKKICQDLNLDCKDITANPLSEDEHRKIMDEYRKQAKPKLIDYLKVWKIPGNSSFLDEIADIILNAQEKYIVLDKSLFDDVKKWGEEKEKEAQSVLYKQLNEKIPELKIYEGEDFEEVVKKIKQFKKDHPEKFEKTFFEKLDSTSTNTGNKIDTLIDKGKREFDELIKDISSSKEGFYAWALLNKSELKLENNESIKIDDISWMDADQYSPQTVYYKDLIFVWKNNTWTKHQF